VKVNGGRVQWVHRTRELNIAIPRDWRGLWLTFYSPRGLGIGLPPETVIGTMQDGTVMRARNVNGSRHTGGPVLGWDNEMLLREGGRFNAEPEPDTTESWAAAVYTAWQLIGQAGSTRWADVEEVPRARAGAKRDARRGITDSGTVRVVNVHQAQRPPHPATAADNAASTGRREPSWSHRWPVRPHRRNHCMAPHQHAEGDCRHEDRMIPGYIKGPSGAPLRTGTTVHLWDHQPEGRSDD
jgi:hypothetical protein